jgi:galactose mutarotase-like enzyme
LTTTDELTLRDADSVVGIAPRRGAITTRFDIGTRHVMFMDLATLHDPTKNVRGGNPVLFPTPGKLAGDAWAYAGKTGSMKQHGFARNQVWQVDAMTTSSAVLSLESDATTRAQFPWDFVFAMTFALHGKTLQLEQRVTNRSTTPMPFGVGFHPYFFVPDAEKPRARIATAARRAFDNVTKRDIELAGPIDLAQPEVDLHLLDHGSTASSLAWSGGSVELRGSAEYTHWVVWTLAGRDFVCLEPWTCPGNALNTGDRLMVLPPGETRTLSLDIEAA